MDHTALVVLGDSSSRAGHVLDAGRVPEPAVLGTGRSPDGAYPAEGEESASTGGPIDGPILVVLVHATVAKPGDLLVTG